MGWVHFILAVHVSCVCSTATLEADRVNPLPQRWKLGFQDLSPLLQVTQRAGGRGHFENKIVFRDDFHSLTLKERHSPVWISFYSVCTWMNYGVNNGCTSAENGAFFSLSPCLIVIQGTREPEFPEAGRVKSEWRHHCLQHEHWVGRSAPQNKI